MDISRVVPQCLYRYSDQFRKEFWGASIVLIVGIALQVFKFSLGKPLIANSLAYITAKLAIKVLEKYPDSMMSQKLEKLREFISRKPRMRQIAILLSLLFCKKAPKASVFAACFSGVLHVVTLSIPQDGSFLNRNNEYRASYF